MNKEIIKLENCLKSMRKCLKIPKVENCICFSDAFKVLSAEVNELFKKIVDEATKSWGINVTDVKIQDIELPADMKRVMAKQAESERERRAVIIRAEGEFAAAEKLSQAAQVLSAVPGGISMRTLQTIEKINPDPSKTVIFALPVEFFEGVRSLSAYLKERIKSLDILFYY